MHIDIDATTVSVAHFTTTSGHFFGNHINIFHKNQLLTVILGVLDLSKSQLDHKLHHKTQFFLFPLLSIFEETILKIDDTKMAFFTIFDHLFTN